MRILLVHNSYGSGAPSGENAAFEAEKTLLEQQGNTVSVFSRHSDDIRKQGLIGLVKASLSVPWNPFTAAAIKKEVSRFKPDVVHAHNTFPMISPSIFHAIGDSSAKVLTLHNYRLLCPAAVPVRNGQVCTQCIERRSVLPALKYGCYRASRLATAPLAVNVALHRAARTWQEKIDAFIALSEFQMELMIKGGIPKAKIYVKPNFYDGDPSVLSISERHPHAVFVGRLSNEKGVRTLIEAWRLWGEGAPLLRIVGDGPLRCELERLAIGLHIEFLGQVSTESAQEQIAQARVLILPSECFEGFPMVIREAFAFGTPVVVSNLGPLPSIVTHRVNGMVFDAFLPNSLLSEVQSVFHDMSTLESISVSARKSFEDLYTEKKNYQIVMNIYEQAIEFARSNRQ